MKNDNDYHYTFRPIIDQIDELNKLANEFKSSPTKLVNLFTEIGIEILKRSIQELEKDFEQKIIDKLNNPRT